MKSVPLCKDLLSQLNFESRTRVQKRPEYLEIVESNLPDIVNRFVQKNQLTESYFIRLMNKAFNTKRFDALLKKWLIDYLLKFLCILDDHVEGQSKLNYELILEDNPLHRFGTEEYFSRFGCLPRIIWKKQCNLLQRIFSILLQCIVILYLSLNRGLRLSGNKRRYKVMREAIFGLYDVGGYYFHDDFLVDGHKIKKEEYLLYSRGIPLEKGRLKAYYDAKRSSYEHFNLLSLSLGVNALFSRIIPKYIISSSRALFKELSSGYFSLYWSIYLYFAHNAILYEKVFSNFGIVSELSHNYFSACHIAESIVCQNYGARYYLMHWSDHSMSINKFILSFLGCDGFLVWGRAHTHGVEGDSQISIPTGYVFKRFINEAKSKRHLILSEMGIRPAGKIITFFDESFGGRCKMTEEDYIVFWETAYKLAQMRRDSTILIKPKKLFEYNISSPVLKKRFSDTKDKMKKMSNLHIADPSRWSFIEFIGISDMVVTQSMMSSSTIALICGIDALYLDQAEYAHPFSKSFKDIIVFDNPEKLLSVIQKIISGQDSTLGKIPEDILRAYDAYADDRGIDLFRSILSGEVRKRVGIVIQARMGSTRLPGKILRPLSGRPMLEILVDRLRKSNRADLLIIATTRNKRDDVIEDLARRMGVVCFRGNEDDVLDRYYKAAKEYNIDVVVRITGDCPFSDPFLIDNLLDYYFDNPSVDYVTNTLKRTYPRGFDIEIFSFESMEKAEKEAERPYQREHVGPFIYENFKGLNYEDKKDSSGFRVTVDTPEDFELVSRIYEYLGRDGYFSYRQVVNLLNSRPDLAAINRAVEQKEIER